MSARVWLASGVWSRSAGPVVFDPPVKITRSGFYSLAFEGDEPTSEPVAEAWWVALERELRELPGVSEVVGDGDALAVGDVLAAVERVRDRR